jgi:DNA-binding response OmpR family regulator/predicted negative regulator of RcsB-dependent stress response
MVAGEGLRPPIRFTGAPQVRVSKQSLLLVDGDTRSMRVLEVSLRKAGFTVTTAVSVQDALDKLELNTPDLIISETTFPEGDGFELPRRVRAAPDWADIPFIFLTAEASIENKIKGLELGVDDYLTKPIYIKEIVTRINILLQKRQRLRFEERKDGHTRFAGRVADMPVVDVIQTIEISRKSGVIQFTGNHGRSATIYFRDGRVIDAEAGALQGEDAIYRLLTWNDGEFEVVFRTVRRREVITTSSQGLLMEGMRRLDEWSRLLEQLPPLTHRFEVDAAELSTRLGDVPDDNNPILRLMDGKRTLIEIIDGSGIGDLECVQAISRLYFEELLIDLDHGQPAKRDTGKPMPLVEVESEPSPIEDAASGPISLHALEKQLETEEPQLPEERASDSQNVHEALVDELGEDPEPPGALMGGYRQSSLRLIDEAVAAAQAIEPSLFTDEELAAAGIAVSRAPTPPATPSTVRPTRESVPPPPPEAKKRNGANGTPVQPRPVADAVPDAEASTADSIPQEITADEPSPPRRAHRPSQLPPQPPSRDDSGLRMIGSLGRDRAEASGELQPGGPPPEPLTETQRELVTILPRRVTREVPLMSVEELSKEPTGRMKLPAQALADPELEHANTPPQGTEVPVTAPVEPVARPSSKRVQGSGVYRRGGPGIGPILLFVLAAVLGTIAVYVWVKKDRRHATAPVAQDAGISISPIEADAYLAAPPDAAELAMADAMVVADAAVAAVPADAALDKGKEAKKLLEAAYAALQSGKLEDALAQADASLKMRRSARAHIVRAQALQKLDRVNDALDAVDQAVELSPTYAPAFELRGRILWAAGRKDEARFAFEQFLALESEGPKAEAIRDLLQENR